MYSEVYESNVKARVRLLFFKEIPQDSPAFMQGRNAALKPRSYFLGEAGNN